MGDFMHDTAQAGAVRREMAARDAEKWGLKWFLIPNPMYGHWDTAFSTMTTVLIVRRGCRTSYGHWIRKTVARLNRS